MTIRFILVHYIIRDTLAVVYGSNFYVVMDLAVVTEAIVMMRGCGPDIVIFVIVTRTFTMFISITSNYAGK